MWGTSSYIMPIYNVLHYGKCMEEFRVLKFIKLSIYKQSLYNQKALR